MEHLSTRSFDVNIEAKQLLYNSDSVRWLKRKKPFEVMECIREKCILVHSISVHISTEQSLILETVGF